MKPVHRKDRCARSSKNGMTTLTKLVVLTSIVSGSHAFPTTVNQKLPVGVLKPVARHMHQNPYYERRRKNSQSLSLGAASLYPADGPSSNLSNDAQTSWQEPVEESVLSTPDSTAISVKDKIYLAIFAGLGVTSMFGLLSMSTTAGCWRYFLAGGVCAAVSHAIPTPIDVVKVRSYQIDYQLA